MTRIVRLLPEGKLTLATDDDVHHAVEPWIPLSATQVYGHSLEAADVAVYGVKATTEVITASATGAEALLRLGSVSAVRHPGGVIGLYGASETTAQLDFRAGRTSIAVARLGNNEAAGDVYSMLTISAAFMLGLKGMALVHAGGVVDRAGGAWLVAGDSHSGKTSTCTALVEAGWSFLADDQIILEREHAGVRVWGWPRRAHLDGGWDRREVTGVRDTVNLVQRWPSRVMTSALLAGVLLPMVRADEPTVATAIHPADVLTAVIRQSPWLIADPAVATRVLPVMHAAASVRAYQLVLGRDSYTRGDVIEARLG